MLKDKSILEKFDLVEELNEKDAEVISGGYEVFQIKNSTDYDLHYSVDGKNHLLFSKGSTIWVTGKEGTIKFDYDMTSGYKLKTYNLSDRRKYEFQYDYSTWAFDINVYDVGYLGGIQTV